MHANMCMYVLDRFDDPPPTRSEGPHSWWACHATSMRRMPWPHQPKADGLPISSIQDHAIKQALRRENDTQTARVHKSCARHPHKHMKYKVRPQLAQARTVLRHCIMFVCTHINTWWLAPAMTPLSAHVCMYVCVCDVCMRPDTNIGTRRWWSRTQVRWQSPGICVCV